MYLQRLSCLFAEIHIELDVLLLTILIGLAAGYVAGILFKGHGFGLIGNIIIGILGAVLGNILLAELGVHLADGLAGQLINAIIGSLVLLVIIAVLKRATR